MKTNSSGKALTVFLVIIIILSVSLSAVAIFFFQKEIERRKAIEATLGQAQANAVRIESELQDAIRQGFLLQERNKEADEKINSLLDDLELAEGVREELKLENVSLKEQVEKEAKSKKELQEKIAAAAQVENKFAELQKKLEMEINSRQGLQEKIREFEARNNELEKKISEMQQASSVSTVSKEYGSVKHKEVELEKIVIAPEQDSEGRILTVDVETEFVIVNLGASHGIVVDQILSVYRGEGYLGDIKITRVQPEMSAADFVPPLTGRRVHVDDRVVFRN